MYSILVLFYYHTTPWLIGKPGTPPTAAAPGHKGLVGYLPRHIGLAGTPPLRRPPTAASEVDMETTRILAVDDEEEICETTKRFLQRKGYTVYTAQNKQQAIEVLKKSRPQLMLLDIRLGAESGLDLLKQAKEVDKDIKVIMVSALDDAEDIRQARSLGADDYVTKPFTTQYLNDFILQKISKLVLPTQE